VLPLGLAGVELGLVLVGFDEEDALTSATRAALSGVAGEASVALARARRFDVEHEIALTLQRSILPVIDTAPAGWAVSTWYQPTAEMVVGGDLFDLTELDDGRLYVIVGDVVGHGLRAAAAMGALRSAAKALSLAPSGPSDVVASLHAFAAATPDVLYSSVCCVEVRPDGSARYASAGHPAPVLRHPDGRTELLSGGRSALLGVGPVVPPSAEFVMPRGSTLVLYTDGLVERRDVDIDTETMRMRNYVSEFPGATARQIVDHMLEGRRIYDDAAVVCLTHEH
jgi:serine phosphatase RsbU (regulator of sigma subunit)